MTKPEITTENPLLNWLEPAETIDTQDILHQIAQDHTPGTFQALSLEQMLEYFNINGTSSHILLKAIAEKSQENYTKQYPQSQAHFQEIKAKLSQAAQYIKTNGAQTITINTNTPFINYQHQGTANLQSIESHYHHDREHAKKIFTSILCSTLLAIFWQQTQQKQNIKTMYDILCWPDRQFGAYGRRGSILNNCILEIQSGQQPQLAQYLLTIINIIINICQETTGSDASWFYTTDSKSLSTQIHP